MRLSFALITFWWFTNFCSAQRRKTWQANQHDRTYPTNLNFDIDNGPVCATSLITYTSFQEAKNNNETIYHCGNCGYCSNEHDIQIYNETRNTLTQLTKSCAIRSILPIYGFTATRRCMERKVNFTTNCLNCWMDNIACTRTYCTVPCLLYGNSMNCYNDTTNPCFVCDETNCGSKFASCAGANRRRLGIPSDIDRNEDELCSLVGL